MGWWDPLETVWYEQPSSEEPAVFLRWFDSLSETQKVLFPTHWVCSEVYNGGFYQYFTNGTGLHAPEAIDGFRKLGLDDIAEIVRQAVSVFDEPFPRERGIREDFLDEMQGDDPFHQLDALFYETIKSEGAPELSEDDRFITAAEKYVALHGH